LQDDALLLKSKYLKKGISSINEMKGKYMITPSYQEIKQLSKEYNYIPISKEIYADIVTPITILRKISGTSKKYFLLESIEGGEKWGRYSFLGFDPIAHVICKDKKIRIDGKELATMDGTNPYSYLRSVLSEYKAPKLPDMPPFVGGFVGYFSYEMIAYTEPVLKLRESEFANFEMMLFDKVIAYDHLKQKISLIVNIRTDRLDENYEEAVSNLKTLEKFITEDGVVTEKPSGMKPSFNCNTDKEEYCRMIEKTKGYIVDGDIFQAVISRRFETEYKDSLINAYRVLRTTNPSPYMVFLKSEDIELICSSPETMVRLKDGKLTTFPIAGSRPRGATKEEDEAIAEELLTDEKELSEHNMLVDLGRNDIGKVSEYGSVKVTDYMRIQRYSKIMHITSEVEGRLKCGKDAFDAIEALLPAGTLSGAPKIRACEIIEELEKAPRGIYGGAVGYIDFTGNMDTCIAIRMAVKKQDKVYIQAGAGIVADSVPEREYEETGYKARALMEALEKAHEIE
jgi:anthranilate synthase component 1